jgi:Fe-S cluster assembly protein SufD
MSTQITEPGWLTERRSAAAARLPGLEMPTFRGVVGWEFTPIDKVDLDGYAPARAGDPEGHGVFDFEGAVRVGSDTDATQAASEGPIVLSIADAAQLHPELVQQHLGTVAKDSPFVARNDVNWTDGVFVYVPRGVHVDAPILVTNVHEQAGSALYTRTLIVLEEGAEAEVWDQTVSADAEADGLVNSVVEIVVGPASRLRYVAAQELNEQTWIFGSQRAIVGRDGHVDWVTLGFGSKNGKVFLETKLAGKGAHATVTGAYASRGRQHLDVDTLQEHAAEHTTSDLAFRGILNDRSSTVWRGMIQVDEGAQQTDAFQESRNLLVSKKAHADAIPGLEILADDVRCTHAAAIAQIDPEQLFYLRSRGLESSQAKRLVIEGFLEATVERLQDGPIREQVAVAIEDRLAAVLGD